MTDTTLWTSDAAAAATGGRITAPWSASGVSIDTRTLEPGDLFVALKGPNFDAHDFIADALDKGAAAVLAERLPEGVPADTPALLVDDTLKGLEGLGRAARQTSRARVVAVTGSVGKTGTKEALATVLGEQGKTHASASSFNNHWGVPLSLARLPLDADYGVFELGMNHAGEIAALTDMVRPDVALITTIAGAHTEFFESETAIADAKAEIFEGVVPGGAAVLPRDNPHFTRLAERAAGCGVGRVLTFGRHASATARLLDCQLYAECSAVQAEIRGQRYDYCLALPGEHWVINSLGVLAAVAALGADVGRAAGALARLQPLKGRGQRHTIRLPGGAFQLIDDSYNANPTSMRAAIAVLGRAKPGPQGRRIAVLGDMRELGASSREDHAGLAEPLAGAGVDLVYTCGAEMAALDAQLDDKVRGGHRDDSDTLARDVAAAVRPGDAVLVKGSLSLRMARVVDALLALDGGAPARAANGD